jgi:hypothetical protein
MLISNFILESLADMQESANRKGWRRLCYVARGVERRVWGMMRGREAGVSLAVLSRFFVLTSIFQLKLAVERKFFSSVEGQTQDRCTGAIQKGWVVGWWGRVRGKEGRNK